MKTAAVRVYILRFFPILLLAGPMILWNCSRDDNAAGPSARLMPLHFHEIAHFDTTEYLYGQRILPLYNNFVSEPVVNWEQTIGEPFIDVNGDGLFNAGTDTFDVARHDLNGNGIYDDRCVPWSPGLPFDDIDGDGRYRPDPGEHISGYAPGLPYADFNGNGRRDDKLTAAYGLFAFVSRPSYGNDRRYSVAPVDGFFRFVSDSGLTYRLPFGYESIMGSFLLTDTGLFYRIYPHDVLLLGAGRLDTPRTDILCYEYQGIICYKRTILAPVSMTVDGHVFSELVCVRLEANPRSWEFYFSREHGFLGYGYKYTRDDYEYYSFEYYYKRLDRSSLPALAATRVVSSE